MTPSSISLDGSTIAVAAPSASSFASVVETSSQGESAPGPATPGPATPGPATPTGSTIPATPDGTTAAAPQGNPFQSLITFALIGAVVWFLIFAPERKARKKREAMLSAVKKGDQIVTTGGIHGEVADVKESTVIVKAGDTRLTFSRASIHEIRQTKDDAAASE